MQENARQGFCNGSRPHFAFKTVESPALGNKGQRKKRLAVRDTTLFARRLTRSARRHQSAGDRAGIAGRPAPDPAPSCTVSTPLARERGLAASAIRKMESLRRGSARSPISKLLSFPGKQAVERRKQSLGGYGALVMPSPVGHDLGKRTARTPALPERRRPRRPQTCCRCRRRTRGSRNAPHGAPGEGCPITWAPRTLDLFSLKPAQRPRACARSAAGAARQLPVRSERCPPAQRPE